MAFHCPKKKIPSPFNARSPLIQHCPLFCPLLVPPLLIIDFSVFLEHAKIILTSGPLHQLYLTLDPPSSYIFLWLGPPCHSDLHTHATSLRKQAFSYCWVCSCPAPLPRPGLIPLPRILFSSKEPPLSEIIAYTYLSVYLPPPDYKLKKARLPSVLVTACP